MRRASRVRRSAAGTDAQKWLACVAPVAPAQDERWRGRSRTERRRSGGHSPGRYAL